MADVVLAEPAARTATGSGAVVSGFGDVTTLRAQLEVTAAAGTAPTLDVTIEDTLDGTNWNNVATFTQLAAAGREVINVTSPFTDRLRVRWTVGGTLPSFTFSVIAYSE